jgi:hypothetical protein
MENAMTDLSHEDRALVDLARDGCEPTDSDRRRMRVALAAQLGVGAGLTSATAVGAASVSAGAASAGAVAVGVSGAGAATGAAVSGGGVAIGGMAVHLGAIKVIAAVLLGGAVAGGGALVVREEMRSAAPSVKAPTPALAPLAPVPAAADPGGTHAAAAPAVVPGVAAVSPEGQASDNGGVVARAGANTRWADLPGRASVPTAREGSAERKGIGMEGVAATVGTPTSAATAATAVNPTESAPTPPTAAPTTLDAETQLVRAGVGALHAGDPAGALAAFDQHARLYPSGFLAEERSGERVLALCDLGRAADASEAARAFLAVYPRSPLAARVRGSCAATSNPSNP